ncbi:unnamed protein product [Lasius platythorax]|uniref:THAP-type domain-containing protein n=1 Tax=Lasius platythorax TaxID=488582 RepID=A0AAV2MXU1_9HYME
MPSCCIKNCDSRTYQSDSKEINFFTFPKEATIRQQWLNACGENENFKVESARIYSKHFDSNSFVMKWTKPRSKETPAKELRRLKPGSVPSKMLILERKENTKEKRKDMSQNESSFEQNKKIKVNHISTRTGIPTYTKLIQFAKEKQNEIEQSMKAETVESIQDVNNMENEAIESLEKDNLQCTRECIKNITEQNDTMKLDMNKEITNEDIPRETLLIHIRTSEKEKQQLFTANQNLELKNQELNMQITQLRDEITKIRKGIQKEVKSKATDVLRKVFTPGQISALMSSTSNRVKWSSEDIMSAISLRSLSPKAYKYLRNVKKIPLPCPTTLYNWVAKFNVLPGTLKDVINIMSSI